jgi:hypothetical protein
MDNCSEDLLRGTTTSPLNFTRSGTYDVVWTFVDANDNSVQATQKIIYEKTVEPIVPPLNKVSISCGAFVEKPSTEDPCTGAIIQGQTKDPLTYTEIGNYSITWNFRGTDGSTSVGVQQIEVLPDQTLVDIETTCDSFVWRDGVTYTESNNTATFIETKEDGCQILYELDLTIQSLDTGITREGNRLIANQEDALYQWIDCNNNNQPIIGATDRIYIPESNGSYAVVITSPSEDCRVFSECDSFQIRLSEDDTERLIEIFPNPMDHRLNIAFGPSHTNVIVQLLTVDNKVLLVKSILNPEDAFIEVDAPAGVYFVKIQSNLGTQIKKIIKK